MVDFVEENNKNGGSEDGEKQRKRHKGKHDKDKPWDEPSIDHWKIDKFDPSWNDAARVMVAAPVVAFVTTHILFLCNYKMDYEWNTKVCIGMGITQLMTWLIWGGATQHPSRWKLWTMVVGDAFGLVVKMVEFPPYQGLVMVSGEALWYALNISLTYMWWSFIKDDAEFRTADLLKKVR